MISPKHWQPIIGKFGDLTDGVTYSGGTFTDSETQQLHAAVGMAVSDVRFSGGVISVSVESQSEKESPSVSIVVSQEPRKSEMLTGGVQSAGVESRFVFQIFGGFGDGAGWTDLASTPWATKKPWERLDLRVETKGSFIDLFADDVHVLRHIITGKVPAGSCGVFARSKEPVHFRNMRVSPSEKNAFVVMQFSQPYNDLFEEVIVPVALQLGVKATRADDTMGPGVIIADIIKQINSADLIIAEITPENPNVFYEVGFAHAVNKPTILIAEKGRKLPFDLSPFRTLFYENSIVGKKKIEEGLRAHITAIFSA